MSITQIGVFVENRPGHIARVLGTLSSHGVNVRGFSASDTGDYGIARFVVDDPARAQEVLREAGCAVATREVLCLKLEDKPGELGRIMGVLAELGVNIEYCYSLVSTYIAVSVGDVAAAEAALAGASVEFIGQERLASASFGHDEQGA